MGRFTLICLLLGIYANYASSFEKNVTLVATSTDVVAGTSVTLACTAFGIDEITWHGPSGQITYLSGCNELSEFNGADVARFRITCSFGIGSQFGTISNLTITSFDPGRDQGSWGCREANEQVAEAYISLTSHEAGIKDINISSTPGSITATNVLTLLEKESDTLTCRAECNGTCQYKWMKAGELVATTSQLSLNNITITASGQYICHASYDGVQLTKSVMISVRQRDYVIFDPPVDLITVSEGQTVSTNCSAENGMCDQNDYRRCLYCWDNHSNTAGTCSEQLVIHNATLSMTGLYRCHYTEEELGINALWSTFKTLEVRVLDASSTGTTLTSAATSGFTDVSDAYTSLTSPAPPVQLPNMTLVASKTTVTTGSSVTLTCSAFAQDELSWSGPSGMITIFKTGCFRLSETDAPDISHLSITCGSGSGALSDWTISILTIISFDPGRDKGYWGCSDYTKSIGDRVYLNSTDAGIKNIKIRSSTGFISSTNGLSLLSEESDVLTCTAECFGICQYKWMKGTELVASTSQLSLNNINYTLRGMYTCIATYNGSELKRSLRLFVQDKSSITINPPGDIITVNEGDSITITCSVDRYPCNNINGITCTNRWDTLSGSFYNTGQSDSMVINMADRTMTGRYRCIHVEDEPSSNTHFETYKSIQLQVQYEPLSVVITPSSDPVIITSGESLSFNCSVDCQPDCSYTWTYNNVIASNIATYIISTINISQSGIYTCTATNTLGSVTAYTNVQVNYGPSSVVITPSSDLVTITRGESLSFNCSADCHPGCNYTWTYNNVIVSTTATFNINSITNSQHGVYSCTATNVVGSAIKSTNVAVNYGPSSVLITPTTDPVNVQYGENVSFVCSSDCKPVCNYRWEYNNVIVSTTATYTTTISQTGTYSCTATNDIGSVRNSSNVVVKSYVKTVVVQSDGTPSTMEPGSAITLTCEADCMPVHSCNYVWKDSQNRMLSVRREITLPNITTSDAGTYTCMASNDVSKSASIQVAIKHAPDAASMVVRRTPNRSSYDKGSSLTLVCSVSCVPDCTIQWSKGTTIFTTSNGVLSLSALETVDSGTYTCSAGNSMGGPIEKTTRISVKITIFGAGSGSSSRFSRMITLLKIVGCLLLALIMF